MNKPEDLSTPFKHELLTQELLTYEKIHVILPRSLIVTTEDRLQLWLSDLIKRVIHRFDWLAPFGIVLSITLTLVTAQFRTFLLAPAIWQAIFVTLDVLAVIWLAFTLRHVNKRLDLGSEIKRLKDFPP